MIRILLAAVLCALSISLTAADKKPEPPPSFDGFVFVLEYLTVKGTKHMPNDKLTFSEKGMQLASLPGLNFSLKLVKKGKECDFSGTATDAMGTEIEISGRAEIKGDDMHGSVTRRPKGEDAVAVAVNFGGKIATMPKPKK